MRLNLSKNRRTFITFLLTLLPVIGIFFFPRGPLTVSVFPIIYLFIVAATMVSATNRKLPLILVGIGLVLWALALLLSSSRVDENGALIEPFFFLTPLGWLFQFAGQLLALILMLLTKRNHHVSTR